MLGRTFRRRRGKDSRVVLVTLSKSRMQHEMAHRRGFAYMSTEIRCLHYGIRSLYGHTVGHQDEAYELASTGSVRWLTEGVTWVSLPPRGYRQPGGVGGRP